MRWMIDIQLGRRNLTPIQRIAVAERYRAIFETKAKERQSAMGGDRGNQYTGGKVPLYPKSDKAPNSIHTIDELAKLAGVGHTTYHQAKTILDSGNEEVKQILQSLKMIFYSFQIILKL